METLLPAAQFLRCWQNAERMYDSLPDASANLQHSDQRSDSVMPGRSISLAMRAWSISAFYESVLTFFGWRAARIAASFVFSGSGHFKPLAFALSATVTAVAVECPHENDTLWTLTPMALSLRFSLYLTICFSFSLDNQSALRAIWIMLEKKTSLAGRVLVLRVNVCQFTVEQCGSVVWSGVANRCNNHCAVLLDDNYNTLSGKLGIHDSAVAYRVNLRQTNIQIARRAFDFRASHKGCSVFVSDLEKFFDSVDHRYIKKQVHRLFDNGAIPDDYYAVLKHVLFFGVWDLEDLHELYGLPFSKTGTRRLNTHDRVLPAREFRALTPCYVTRLFDSGTGMPRGSPPSCLLANVQLFDFDAKIRKCADAYGGLYLRYSDGIIFAVPSDCS